MSVMSPESLDITEFVEDIEEPIPCDYADRHWHAGFGPTEHTNAEWILHWRCPHCSKGLPRIVCTPCKDLMMSTPHGVSCYLCKEAIVPAKDGLSRVEPL